jgi:hypothetical protein
MGEKSGRPSFVIFLDMSFLGFCRERLDDETTLADPPGLAIDRDRDKFIKLLLELCPKPFGTFGTTALVARLSWLKLGRFGWLAIADIIGFLGIRH